ncbi:MAG TPA: CRISPR-associated endonuclease Cas1 [Bryobacteraceae bacterium]|nr:CRISPR-associated endonuclease Cas1 [Bryobacteraceae bacterium]
MELIQWSAATHDLTSRTAPIDAERSSAAEAHSRFLYLTEPGIMLRRAGNRLRITRKKELLRELSVLKLQGVLCYGNVQVSSQCLRSLLEEGVWLAFFSGQGAYRGRLQPPAECGGRLRARQWELTRDLTFSLAFSRAVVRAKILAARHVASSFAKHNLAETLGDGATLLRAALDQVGEASIDGLRGVEGSAARAYFDLFRRWNKSAIPFEGREKRGATTPINILLNIGYTLLTNELNGLIEAAGLDPAAGFYHQPDADRPSLACDWVEEFRHLIVDRLVLRLINQGTIKAGDFIDLEERGLRLGRDALRKLIAAYEKSLNGNFAPDAEEGDAKGWRAIFLRQLGRLVDAIRDRSPYEPHNAV